jgi:hypothetical protein
MEFEYQGTTVKLQGILLPYNSAVSEISGEQLHKQANDNDMCALVMVMAGPTNFSKQEQYLVNVIPLEVQQLIIDSY